MAATGSERLYISTGGAGRATVSAQEVADLAGPGGAVSLSELTDVNLGASFPLTTSDMLLYFGAGEGEGWQNVPNADAVAGAVQGWLASLPGFAANQIFAVNAAGNGFEWVAP